MGVLKPGFDRGIVALVLILTGCAGARVMMPTPNVHLDPKRDFYGELHRELQSTEVPLFYVTDLLARLAAKSPQNPHSAVKS